MYVENALADTCFAPVLTTIQWCINAESESYIGAYNHRQLADSAVPHLWLLTSTDADEHHRRQPSQRCSTNLLDCCGTYGRAASCHDLQAAITEAVDKVTECCILALLGYAAISEDIRHCQQALSCGKQTWQIAMCQRCHRSQRSHHTIRPPTKRGKITESRRALCCHASRSQVMSTDLQAHHILVDGSLVTFLLPLNTFLSNCTFFTGQSARKRQCVKHGLCPLPAVVVLGELGTYLSRCHPRCWLDYRLLVEGWLLGSAASATQ